MLEDGFWYGPIMDQHIHLDRRNLYLKAIEEFVKVGGTSINLVHKPDFNNLPRKISEYQILYHDTVEMANEVRNNFDIDVSVILGPHPVTWEKQIKTLGIEESTKLHLEAVELALEFISDGHAVCLGEVGRPHYQVNQNTWKNANKLLLEIMKITAKEKVSIQLHVEDNGKETYRDISKLCEMAEMPKEKTIRHFAPPNLNSQFTNGVSSTISVGKGSVEKIIDTMEQSKSIWGMETDFLDDMKRPGAVLGLKTVPKRTQQLCKKMWELEYSDNQIIELMENIHSRWPKEIYS